MTARAPRMSPGQRVRVRNMLIDEIGEVVCIRDLKYPGLVGICLDSSRDLTSWVRPNDIESLSCPTCNGRGWIYSTCSEGPAEIVCNREQRSEP